MGGKSNVAHGATARRETAVIGRDDTEIDLLVSTSQIDDASDRRNISCESDDSTLSGLRMDRTQCKQGQARNRKFQCRKFHIYARSEERRVGKECRSRW